MCKFGRKFTSALLALALLVSLLPLGAAPAQAEGLTIKINSEKELWDFSYALSQNTPGYANANVSLEGDIDVAISSWVPIGTDIRPGMPAIDFTGTFDGNGHTIKNIHIVDRTYNPTPAGDYRSSADVGLFARLDSGGTVKNLKVTGSVSGGEMGINVGGIVGQNSGGSVTNCTFSGSVNGRIATNVGGIVGLNSGSVTDCTNSGGVSGKGNVGGVVGDNSGSVTDCSNTSGFSINGSGNFGGVVGNNSGSVTDCSNSGGFSVPMTNPPSSASGNLGGVVGQNSGADARITSCYNTGDLCNNFPSGSFDGNLGGVVGSNSGNSGVMNCYSTGTIGNSNVSFVWGTVGGVVGSNSGNSSVTNCYNTGNFGSFINSTVGGVVGNNGATVDKCYFLKTETVNAGQAGIGNDNTHTGATAVSDLTNQNEFKGWDFANIWRSSQSLNRPVLQENAQDGLPPGLGTEASPYRISTADELKSFRDIVNGEDGTVQITLAHDGEFGFTMTLSAPLGEENAGYWANLYHYDEEAETLNFEAAAEIDQDGNVKIPFTHASQYAIVIDDHSHATVPVSDIFIDIAPDAWYKDAVQYAYDNGLMTGVSATEFAPEATTTRAMIVSILARLENVTSAESAGFSDVSDGDWYATAVNWAANVGVVNGYEDNTFRPNTAITREQLAAMLMNYSAWKGEDVSARADLSAYSDVATISIWANDVMQWAVAEGLISGMTEDTLQPQGNATRAQVAAILERFLAQ